MLLNAHSGFRYLVLILAVAVIAYSAFGLATRRPYDKTMRILASSFTMALDMTVLLGLANLFTGTFYPQLSGHIAMMVMALAVAHVVSFVMRRRPFEERTYTPHLVGTLIVLGLIAFGILAIRPSIVG